MIVMSRRVVHLLIAISLLACLLCPFVEIVVHSNDNIFNEGYDTESAVALLLLVLELVLLLPRFLVLLLPNILKKEQFLTSDRRSGSSPHFNILLPELYLPLPLRI
jgi:hypothetical protein